MSNDQKLPWAEIKAGLKLAKEAYEVLVNDTDYVKGIRLHLERIDAALQSGNLDIILHCNGLVTNEYKNLLVSNNVRFASQSTLREKGFYWNFINLRDIGQLLYHEIYKDKIIEGTIALLAVSCEYICDKIADSAHKGKAMLSTSKNNTCDIHFTILCLKFQPVTICNGFNRKTRMKLLMTDDSVF